MQSLYTLINASIPLLSEGYRIGLDWLGQFVQAIIESVGIIGVGIICFTLILKAITLPFDSYQRYKSRKQTLIMRGMKDDLDKLQKQYANDKTMYNQKMMELYKKNGYNVFAACLPMLISFAVIIVAFQGFNAYSRYANLDFFVQMSASYNSAITAHGTAGIDYTLLRDEGGNIVAEGENYTLVYGEGDARQEKSVAPGASFEQDGCVYTLKAVSAGGTQNYLLSVVPSDEAKFIYYEYSPAETRVTKSYYADTARLSSYLRANDAEAYAQFEAAENKETAAETYVKKLGADSAKNWYENNRANFLWVENVWYPDVSYNHPIPETYAKFQQNFGSVQVTFDDGSTAQLQSILTEKNYEDLTASLTEEKEAPNGYFGLIILSIGLMVLSQFVMMRSQKESNQYQTVDGQGAKTQKIMLIAMPLIYAVFAFMYSAAFTIYMLISSLFSLLVTLISNFILGIVFKKKEEQKVRENLGYKPQWMIDREQREGKDQGKSRKNTNKKE